MGYQSRTITVKCKKGNLVADSRDSYIKGSRLKCSGYRIQNNVNNLNKERRDASRHFSNKN